MMATSRRRHATLDDEFDPEVTEGGAQAPPTPPPEEETLEQFLHQTFGEEAPQEGDPPPEPGNLPSLAWVKRNFKTKSAAIRWLVNRSLPNGQAAHTVSEIAKLLNVKYQHVRNVKTTHLKRGPNEDWNLERRKASTQEELERKLREERKG